jgi:hypothetical protein
LEAALRARVRVERYVSKSDVFGELLAERIA